MKKEEKLKLSLRIGVQYWVNEKSFDAFIKYAKSRSNQIDEIMYFTQETHTPLTAEAIKERMPILADRVAKTRAAGFKTGIDVITTMGHHEENIANALSGCTDLTDIHGNVCHGAYCPNDEKLIAYVKEVLEEFASAKPDFIYVDDDIRHFGHGGIEYACFCDNCIEIFNKKTGGSFTRESLKEAFNGSDIKSSADWRSTWIEHNRNSIGRILTVVEETIHGTDPEIQLGFMTCGDAFGDIDYQKVYEILAGKNKVAVKWRPGGGFYSEDMPMELIKKAHRTGRQIALLHPDVSSISSEIENFPYALLRKSAKMTNLEAAAYIACGCTGTAYNILPEEASFDEYEPYFAEIDRMYSFFELMTKTLGRSPCEGIGWVWGKDTCIDKNNSNCDWPRNIIWGRRDEHLTIGLPVDYTPVNQNSQVFIAMEDDILSATHEEIMLILSKGIFMDLKTLNHLNRLGYGEYTGFKCTESRTADCREVFTDHPLNGSFAGCKRDGRQSFWKFDAAILTPNDEKAQSLSSLINYAYEKIGDCTMGVYENSLGGRVCISGYFPLDLIYSLAKTSQLKSVFRWLSHDNLPGYITSYHRANIWIRRTSGGTAAVTVLNTSFDKAVDLTIALKTQSKNILFYDTEMNSRMIQATSADSEYNYFTLPCIDAWDIGFLVEVL